MSHIRRLLMTVVLGTGLLVAAAPAASAAPPAVPVPDATGDGWADVVTRQAGRLVVYPHNGAPTANPWTTKFEPGSTGWDIVRIMLLADATGDGKPDLVAIRTDNTLWVYPHNGATGTAASWSTPYPTGITGWGIADWVGIGDLTGDGKPDLLARYQADGTLWAYPHNGGTGTNANWTGPYSTGTDFTNATGLLLGDVTNDGRADLVARDGSGNLVVHVTGSGARIPGGGGWMLATTLALRDVTGDGRPEIVARDGSGALWIYPHNGSSTSNPWTQTRIQAGTGWQTASALLL